MLTITLSKIKAIVIDGYGERKLDLCFVTEKNVNKFEYLDHLVCKNIEFYPYAGFFGIKIKGENSCDKNHIIIDFNAKEEMKNIIEKGNLLSNFDIDNEETRFKYYLPRVWDEYLYIIPELKALRERLRLTLRELGNKLYTSQKEVSLSYEEWHLENFKRITLEMLDKKSELTYEDIIKVLEINCKKEPNSFISSRIEDYKKNIENNDKDNLCVVKNPSEPKNSFIINKKNTKNNDKDSLSSIKSDLVDCLTNIENLREAKLNYAFIKKIKSDFEDYHKEGNDSSISILNSIEKEIKDYKKNINKEFSLKIKPLSFTIFE